MLRDVTVSCRFAQPSAVVWQPTNRQLRTMCGRVIQSGGPIRYAIVDGIDVHDILFNETQGAGRTLGIEVQSLEVRGPDDLDGAFEAARKQRPDARPGS